MRKYGMGLHVILCCAVILSAGLWRNDAYAVSQPAWENLPAGCFPDRAQKWVDGKPEEQQAACHCPPSSMCPSASDYAIGSTAWAMPPVMVDQCCQKPACTIDYRVESNTKCPGLYSTGFQFAEFCTSYKPVEVAGDAVDPKVVAEKTLRDDTTKILNSCLSACYVDLSALEGAAVASYNYSLGGLFSSSKVGISKTSQAESFEQYVNCEFSCRQAAASSLKLPRLETVLENGSINFSRAITGIMPKQLPDFFNAVYGGTWKRADSDRNQRVKDYLASRSETWLNAGEGLKDKLICETQQEGVPCMTLKLNNGSCSSCLAPGTKVIMADGKEQTIETIAKGDKVKGLDDKNRPVVGTVSKLVKIDWPTLTLYNINDGALLITADHPIRTTAGWRAVDYNTDIAASMDKYGLDEVPVLKVGDIMLTDKGTVQVRSIKADEIKKDAVTYNLRIDDGDSFFANGVLVKDN